MSEILSYNTIQERAGGKHNFRSIFILMAVGVLGGLAYFGGVQYDRQAQRRTAVAVVESLIQEGNYASIRSKVSDTFLGDLTEKQYDDSAVALTDIGDAKIEIDGVKNGVVYGALYRAPTDEQEGYYFTFDAAVERNGLGYKVTSLATDYGSDVVANSPSTEYLNADEARNAQAEAAVLSQTTN